MADNKELIALNLDEDGRCLSATFSRFAPESQPRVESLPEGDLYEYRYVNGEFIHDPLPEEEVEEETLEEKVAALQKQNAELLEALLEISEAVYA